MTDETINVEVVYALPEKQEIVALRLPAGANLLAAIEASGLIQKYPGQIDPSRNKFGVYAKLAKTDTLLRDRDRVEIYRPLIADPKAARAARAEKAAKKAGGKVSEASEASETNKQPAEKTVA